MTTLTIAPCGYKDKLKLFFRSGPGSSVLLVKPLYTYSIRRTGSVLCSRWLKYVVVFVTTAGPPEYWITIGPHWSFGEMQIPVRKVMPWQEDESQMVVGWNPRDKKGFLIMKFLSKWACTVVEFVHYISVSCTMYWLSHLFIWQMYPELEAFLKVTVQMIHSDTCRCCESQFSSRTTRFPKNPSLLRMSATSRPSTEASAAAAALRGQTDKSRPGGDCRRFSGRSKAGSGLGSS